MSNPPSRESEPRLKICVLAACPFPANHGTPGSIRELSEAVAERGHEVHIVTYQMGQESIPLKHVKVHRIGSLFGERGVKVGPTIRKPIYDAQLVAKATRVIRKFDLDIIHAHGYEAALAARLCRALTWRRFVYSGHNTMADELASYDFFRWKRLARGLARVLDYSVPRMADRCIPHSEGIEKFFARQKLQERCEPVINFGIDLREIAGLSEAPGRAELGLPADRRLVLYTGVMNQFQRLDLLFHAMRIVVDQDPQAHLVMVVTIPQKEHLEALRAQVRDLQLEDRVTFTSPQQLAGVHHYLSHCEAAVVPRPDAPGFPIKLLNYMAASRACVLFESSASGLAHRDNAWLAKEDTAPSMAEGILAVLRDDELRRRLQRNGRLLVQERHDRGPVARQICDVYLRTLEGTRRWRKIQARPSVAAHQSSPPFTAAAEVSSHVH